MSEAHDGDETEGDLVRRWRGGDLHAAALLLQAHRTELARYFARRTGDAAEDLLQDTYLEVFRSGARFRSQDGFGAFAWSVARRLVRVRLQRMAANVDDTTEPDRTPGCEPNALSLIERRQVSSLLDQAVSGLPEEQRRCLHLLLRAEQSPAEIALGLGVSISTVSTRLQRAKLRLGVALASIRP